MPLISSAGKTASYFKSSHTGRGYGGGLLGSASNLATFDGGREAAYKAFVALPWRGSATAQPLYGGAIHLFVTPP